MLSSLCLDVHAGESGIQLQGATAAVMLKTLIVYGMHYFHIPIALIQKKGDMALVAYAFTSANI